VKIDTIPAEPVFVIQRDDVTRQLVARGGQLD
jgi:hypothetical protein